MGLPASLSPVISNASIAVATAFVGSYGTAALAGYGVAARLEYILVPIAFGFGTALTAMVATNMGAGQSARAVRVAWVGGAVVAAITGGIGVVTALAPALWMNLFTTDAEVLGFGARYLNIVGGCYAFFGLGLALFFASQGAGRMFWPLAGSMARLVVLVVGGWLCVHVFQTSATALFAVIAFSLVRLWFHHRHRDPAGQLDAMNPSRITTGDPMNTLAEQFNARGADALPGHLGLVITHVSPHRSARPNSR